MVRTRPAAEEDLPQILLLQSSAHRAAVSAVVAAEEGFVSWRHDLQTLRILNEPIPHTVAVDEAGLVVGYALSTSPEHRDALPAATQIFAVIETLPWNNTPLAEQFYTLMGQVCVAPAWRGKGLFRQMYGTWFRAQAARFEVAVTVISRENTRSLSAHGAIGWQPIGNNFAGNKNWAIVARAIS